MKKLKCIYSILMKLDQREKIVQSDFDIDKEEWGDIAELILDEGLAKGISVTKGGQGNKVQSVWYDNAKITLDGLRFLEDNDAYSLK
ncbi:MULTISPECIES: YjcQ family protein [Bacillaceae]|uniref:YjcQ family protein n=1 Tax=Bacillaceae TaxID=186817 RepID=UPI00158EDAB0|nr:MULTISPECIES: YjcQ family protein [Bacillaceae]MBH9968897.1 hypothetical protein [[Bacillus] enclensis]